MKIANAAALVTTLAVCALAEDIVWDGADGLSYVASGGYWFQFDDASHGGNASTNFPATDAGDFAIAGGGMFDVTYSIKPTSNAWPYTAIGFNWSDPQSETPQTWDYICVEYTLEGSVPIQLTLNNDYGLTHDQNYYVVMPKQSDMTKTCFAKGRFKTLATNGPTWDECMQKTLGINFIGVMAAPAEEKTSEFKLKFISTGIGTIPDPIPLLPSSRATAIRAVHQGQTLHLEGLAEGPVSVDLLDLQGNVALHTNLAADQTVDLSRLPAGTYLVRIPAYPGLSQSITVP